MGACCGGSMLDPEIEACKTVAELEALMIRRKAKLPIERNELEVYLKDNTKEIKSINLQDKSDASLNKRITYLNELEVYYEKYIDALHKYPELPLKETKERMQEVYGNYILMYDDTNTVCKKTYDNFNQFLKEKAK